MGNPDPCAPLLERIAELEEALLTTEQTIIRKDADMRTLAKARSLLGVKANRYAEALDEIRNLQSTVRSKSKQAQAAHDISTMALEGV